MFEMQREEPVTGGGRPHGRHHQADVQMGIWCRSERLLREGLLTLVSRLQSHPA